MGAGGEQKNIVSRVKAVRFGQITIDNPTLSVSEEVEGSAGATADYYGIIGAEIFRRFKLILDYSRKRMILEPNSSFSEAYDVAMTGFGLGSDEGIARFKRLKALSQSVPPPKLACNPAITAIDGRAVLAIPSNDFEWMLKQEGKELTLTIKRGMEIIQNK